MKLALGLLYFLMGAANAGTGTGNSIIDAGFSEIRVGARIENDAKQKSFTVGEARLQIEKELDINSIVLTSVTDFLIDPVLDVYSPDLETGEGILDPRQLNILFSPLGNMDVKIGRQILTWGTGDLLFINDLFPKDFNSFFIGRDEEYLKAPVDAIKASFFFEPINFDLVYTPKFNADRFIDGKRISFFDRAQDAFRGNDDPVMFSKPNDVFSDDEVAIRLYRNFHAVETALYYYKGFWKSPAGVDSQTGKSIFPELQVFGASLRSPLAGGIANFELGYYKSAAGAGKDPLLRNSEVRVMLGYEREIARELTGGIQYYLERKLDYQEYLNSLPPTALANDEDRSIVTLRLTKSLLQQDLNLSFFKFYSPSDEDGYLRLTAAYKFTDAWKIEGGLNYFYGKEPHTGFAQFEDASNLYIALRYSF